MRSSTRFALTVSIAAALTLAVHSRRALADERELPATTQAGDHSTTQPAAQKARALIDSGLAFLKSRQLPDGGWNAPKAPPAITALALKAFVEDPKYSTRDEFIKKGYDRLLSYQGDNGAISNDMMANYNTAIAVSALAAAKDPALKPAMEKSLAFLKALQWTDKSAPGPKGEAVGGKEHPWYGGWGYGKDARPDLSNEHFSVQALHDAGLKPDDPAYKAALEFITKCQNNSETNTGMKWAGDDGGFIYGPANGEGDSEAGEFEAPDGQRRWRSYGSMTYAGLKSMIYAGLSKDDPRVKGAIGWIGKNWTLDENPGMRLNKPEEAQHGLYYYFYVFGHALNAYDEPTITDSRGKQHDWRVELIDKVASTQHPDGSWSGEKRWMEGDPVLVTAYTVLALQEAEHSLEAHPAR